MNLDTQMPSGTTVVTIFAVYAETWYRDELVESNYWNASEDRTRVERDVENFRHKTTQIFEGRHSGKRGVFLSPRLVERTFTIVASEWRDTTA